jgi:hypothetical protein
MVCKTYNIGIGIDFGIGIDQNSWYRTGIVSKPKKLVSPITIVYLIIVQTYNNVYNGFTFTYIETIVTGYKLCVHI